MLKLTKKAEYALMAARYMALKNSTGFCTAKEISDSHQIPYQLVAKVLNNLVKGGIAVSAKGVNGGFSLARKAETISLINIIRAVESNFRIVDCMQVNSSSADCEHFDCCKLKDPLAEVQRKIDKVFVETSVAQIL